MMDESRARRELVVQGLNELPGVSCRRPRGALYAFPNVSRLPIPADELAERLLEEASVATLAGSSFGRFGTATLRISYASAHDTSPAHSSRCAGFLD